jgi:hypothetical protein
MPDWKPMLVWLVLFLGTGSQGLTIELRLVHSFSTEEVSEALVTSVAVDPVANVLLVGTEDGHAAILELSREGGLIGTLAPPGDRDREAYRGIAADAATPRIFGASNVWINVLTRGGELLGGSTILSIADWQGLALNDAWNPLWLHISCPNTDSIVSLRLFEDGGIGVPRFTSLFGGPATQWTRGRPIDPHKGIAYLPDDQVFLLARRAELYVVRPFGIGTAFRDDISVVWDTADLSPLGVRAVEDLAYDPVEGHTFLVDTEARAIFELEIVRPPRPPAVPFHRADTDQDGATGLGDVLRLLEFAFRGRRDLGCLDAADVQDDNRIDPADALYLLYYLYLDGLPPLLPGPAESAPCGPDPDPDFVRNPGCRAYGACP